MLYVKYFLKRPVTITKSLKKRLLQSDIIILKKPFVIY